mmetsp:Transcript_20782/g.49538  ORF Transcript_20782/g.49538 Transcript_20782/m.49538 type:complete len:316 (+) Transcript_20782:197-1144(+)
MRCRQTSHRSSGGGIGGSSPVRCCPPASASPSAVPSSPRSSAGVDGETAADLRRDTTVSTASGPPAARSSTNTCIRRTPSSPPSSSAGSPRRPPCGGWSCAAAMHWHTNGVGRVACRTTSKRFEPAASSAARVMSKALSRPPATVAPEPSAFTMQLSTSKNSLSAETSAGYACSFARSDEVHGSTAERTDSGLWLGWSWTRATCSSGSLRTRRSDAAPLPSPSTQARTKHWLALWYAKDTGVLSVQHERHRRRGLASSCPRRRRPPWPAQASVGPEGPAAGSAARLTAWPSPTTRRAATRPSAPPRSRRSWLLRA